MITFMNMTGIYEQESFCNRKDSSWVQGKEIAGTKGYCSEEAQEQLRQLMVQSQEKKTDNKTDVHFLDSGNYHYLSKLWLEQVKEPFDLLVFDYHTDMQEAAFGDILSCGSWILDAIRTNHNLSQVYLVGANPKFQATIHSDCKGRYQMFDVKELCAKSTAQKNDNSWITGNRPLYISIDKDVLSKSVLCTDWDQGDMSLKELGQLLQETVEKREICGVDICGEPDMSRGLTCDIRQSSLVNQFLLDYFDEGGMFDLNTNK